MAPWGRVFQTHRTDTRVNPETVAAWRRPAQAQSKWSPSTREGCEHGSVLLTMKLTAIDSAGKEKISFLQQSVPGYIKHTHSRAGHMPMNTWTTQSGFHIFFSFFDSSHFVLAYFVCFIGILLVLIHVCVYIYI